LRISPKDLYILKNDYPLVKGGTKMKKALFIGLVVLVSFYSQPVVSPFTAVWVDDDYAVAEDTDGDMYFKTISAAVNAVYENGTVNVNPGVYTPAGQITLKNGVTLQSIEGAAETIIDFVGVWCGYWSTGAGGVDIPYGVSNAAIEGFTIKGGSSASDALISIGGCNNTVRNNIVIGDPGSGGQDIGIHIGDLAQGAQQLPSGNLILNNHIYNHAGSGVFVGNWAGTDNVISGNTVHDNVIGGIPGLNGNGIELDRAYSATVTNNVVYNNEATGIKIVRAPGSAVFKIVYNVITANPVGVLNDSWFTNTVLVEITCNDITDNGIGVQNNENTIINAEINWWGSTSGPYHAVLNPAGTGDIISDYVDFSPWGLHADPCRSWNTHQYNHPSYDQYMCPLARKNFQEGTSLLIEIENQLTLAQALDLDTARIEELLAEAKALLEQARLFCKNSQNCIAGNTLALQAQALLREIQDRLESMLT
jgi:parallel beta-helix repeat protein